MTMTPSVILRCGALHCEVAPQLGAAIAGLWRNDLPVLRSTPAAQLSQVRLSACYPLVPFSNRVAHATLLWNGTSHPLVGNFAPEPHAIHGVAWMRPWQVLDASDGFALLSFEHQADANWPFGFDCSQAFRLSPDALEVTLSVTNQSDQAAPFGLGWHPFFAKRPASRIGFKAAGRWDMGPDKLPTQRRSNSGMDVDCDALDIDHCFDGWRGDVVLQDPQMTVRLSASLDHLVVFTHPGCDFVAIEPVSHVNNAINMAGADAARLQQLGVRVLQPGESMSATMRIETGPGT